MRVGEWWGLVVQDTRRDIDYLRNRPYILVLATGGGTGIGLGVSFVLYKLSWIFTPQGEIYMMWGCILYVVACFVYCGLQNYRDSSFRIYTHHKDTLLNFVNEQIFFPREPINISIRKWQDYFHTHFTKDEEQIDVLESHLVFFINRLRYNTYYTEEELECVRVALEHGKVLFVFFSLPEMNRWEVPWRNPYDRWGPHLENFEGHPGYDQIEIVVKKKYKDFLTYRKQKQLEPFHEELMEKAWAPERIGKWIELERWDLLD